jgi:CRISPR-associated endonuclease/helicase Cas3
MKTTPMEAERGRMRFDQFFIAATDHAQGPFDYQCRLACGERLPGETEAQWLAGGTDCNSRLINIPTGLGKTAAVVLAWLWNRIGTPSEIGHLPSTIHQTPWPRRLVYCLPMRTLVEQTEREIAKWLTNLWNKADALGLGGDAKQELEWLEKHSPIILMGGEEADRDWDVWPEKPAILIGTQDMLLSRALNRGYGMSRYRWPMHFGLLNNDCLWVMDETQLMGPGLGTACQLEALRSATTDPTRGLGSFGAASSVTWYLSATSNPDNLKTREWRIPGRPDGFELGLSPEEKAATAGPIHQRRFAVKQLELRRSANFADAASSQELAAAVLERHEQMVAAMGGNPALPARTLVLLNAVDRAVAVHAQLAKAMPERCDLLLLHSRFRPPERREQMKRLESVDRAAFPNGQIVVATQVIEAGVDISSGLLWSEVAPLASLVQRLGRLNRAGEFNESAWKPRCFIVGIQLPDLQKKTGETTRDLDVRRKYIGYLPYEWRSFERVWESLEKLDGNASPVNLEQIQGDIATSIPRCPYSLQRHELLDFFDTDANLSLGFTDVSPFVRGLDDDTDLQVLWRESWLQRNDEEGTGEPELTPDFQRDELCPVPISKAKDPKARDVLKHGWIWRGKESGWLSMRDLQPAPGMTILLPLDAGGYDNGVGWTGDKADNKHGSHYQPKDAPTDEEQLSSLANGWQSIAVHTAAVTRELREELRHLLSAPEHKSEHSALLDAVPWHDVGKNHFRWRRAALRALLKAGFSKNFIRPNVPVAKFSLGDSPTLRNADGSLRFSGKELVRELKKLSRFFRPGIAHEVASALAFRQYEEKRFRANGDASRRDTDLVSLLTEYVIMSHHGRVRKVLRDEIPKFPRGEKDTNTVRGVSEGDPLPAVVIEGQPLGCERLSTECRRMGRPFTRPDTFGHESYTRGVLRLLENYGPFRLAFFEALFRAADARASRTSSPSAKPGTGPGVSSGMELREEPTAYGATSTLTPAEQSLVADLVADGLSIQDKFKPEPLYKQTGKGHYASKTVEEIQRARQAKAKQNTS